MARNPKRKRAVPVPIVALAVVLVIVAGYRVLSVREARARHPEPRPGVTAERVMPAQYFAAYPRVASVYREAAAIPHVLDGLYCYCDCSKHSGHRSLLTCFESDHAAACDVCLGEALMAAQMTGDGASLDEIREAIDRTYGAAR